ncbi:A/G-specific adenine glycosylase [Fusibacter sp. 3D3]|uniref:A/G-specific adenine glycosylase n=1 Tax=Fusibacter sp. 3D3 TaxID=1048380 RepID=UPI000852E167|nr:A/G-specific adenine glycosylase [Fusibacter sp. 3D3]GAU78091.1 A/G-specific adenine glycosylase [Fusibacter sp. 3D3]
MDKKLLEWYQKNKREMPWRETHDPYFIWLSEIMLQQTQVITVIDYYNRFIKKFGDVKRLAEADEQEVLKHWEGLGYYSRARNLHKCAQVIVSHYEGKFPRDYKQLLELPGIGPYTAGAILSIAYNERVPAVDGNVMRVYSRYFKMNCDISDPKSRAFFESKVMANMPDDARHFNQALMELGAIICTPKTPKCETCPIASECLAKESNSQLDYPIKTQKIEKRHENVSVLLFVNQGKVMIEKRNDALLLKGLWGFPTYGVQMTSKTEKSEVISEDTLMDWIHKNYDFEGQIMTKIPVRKHVFTHLVWHMTMIIVKIESPKSMDYPEVKWVVPTHLEAFPLPTAFKKNLSEEILEMLV